LTYNKVLRNSFFLILETKWQRNNCANKRWFFGRLSELATELSYIFT